MDSNFIFSPAGLSCVLEILRDGMNEQSDIYNKVSELIMYTNSYIDTTNNNEDFKLEHATSIWYNKKLGFIKEDYLNNIADSYDAEAHNADFSQKIKTKLWIDKWVSDNTDKMIKKLDAELSEDVLMVVLDAIYMNGKWKNPFEIDQTEIDIFHNSDGTECEVGCCPLDDMPPIITMILNRPFGFAIKGELGQLLLMGVIRNMNGTII